MKILGKKITNKNFCYKQIIRENNVAIYEQSLIDSEIKNTNKRYEVIIIKSHEGYEINGNKIPPSEMYPSANHWGTLGWTCMTMEDAQKRFKKVKNSELKKQTPPKK
jgi:hypothetical protein